MHLQHQETAYIV